MEKFYRWSKFFIHIRQGRPKRNDQSTLQEEIYVNENVTQRIFKELQISAVQYSYSNEQLLGEVLVIFVCHTTKA